MQWKGDENILNEWKKRTVSKIIYFVNIRFFPEFPYCYPGVSNLDAIVLDNFLPMYPRVFPREYVHYTLGYHGRRVGHFLSFSSFRHIFQHLGVDSETPISLEKYTN